MKKGLFFFVTIVLICCVSCSPTSKSEPRVINKSVSDIPEGSYVEMDVTSTDEITLSNFTEEDGVLISVVGGSKDISKSKDSDPDLIITQNGLGMPVPHDNGQTSFMAGAINVGNSGKIRIEHFELDSDLEIKQEEMESTTTNGRPKTINKRGELVTEEFYRIDLRDGQYAGYDVDEVAIIQIIKGNLVNFSNPEYGFIKNGKIDLSTNGNEIYGLVDLRHKKAITVFNTIEYKGGVDMLCKIALVIPQELTPGSELDINSNTNVYKVTKEGKAGNYVVEITTNGTDYYNSDYHILLRSNARARYIEGNITGTRRVPNLIPITRTGDKIIMWVGEVDESFIFDCCIDDTRTYCGKIELRRATTDEEAWASSHILSDNTSFSLILHEGESVAYYLTGMNGDYTLEVNVNGENATAEMQLLYGNKNDSGCGSLGFNHSIAWSRGFHDGYIILSFWQANKDFDLDITLSNIVHTNIRYNPDTGRFECEDDGCNKYFDALDAGDLLVGKWQMDLDGEYAKLDIQNWGDVPITVRKNGKEKTIHAEASFNPDTMQIFLDIPAPYKKHYELQSFCYGQSMTFTDGTVLEKIIE